MKANEFQISEFDRYLTGEMSASEKKLMEENLRNDPKTRDAFEEYINIAQIVDEAGRMALRNKFAAATSSIPESEIKPYQPGGGKNISKSSRNWNAMTWIMIIGSVLLMIAFVIALLNLPDLEKKLRVNGDGKNSSKSDTTESNCISIIPTILIQDVDSLVDMLVEVDTCLDNNKEHIMLCLHPATAVNIQLKLRNRGDSMAYVDGLDSIIAYGLDCEVQVIRESYNRYIIKCGETSYQLTDKGFESIVDIDTVYNPILSDSMASGNSEDLLDFGEEKVYKLTENWGQFKSGNFTLTISPEIEEGTRNKKDSLGTVSPYQIKSPAHSQIGIIDWLRGNLDLSTGSDTLSTKQGKIKMLCVVNKHGKANFNVLESIGSNVELRIVECLNQMPLWTPSRRYSDNLAVKYRIVFLLELKHN